MALTPKEEQMLYLARLNLLAHEGKDAFFIRELPTLERLANDPQAIEKMVSAGIFRLRADIIKRWAVNLYPALEAGIPELTPQELVSFGVPNTSEILGTVMLVFHNIYTLANSRVEDVQLSLPTLNLQQSNTIIANAQKAVNVRIVGQEPHLHQIIAFQMDDDGILQGVAQSTPYDPSQTGSKVVDFIQMLVDSGFVPKNTDQDDTAEK